MSTANTNENTQSIADILASKQDQQADTASVSESTENVETVTEDTVPEAPEAEPTDDIDFGGVNEAIDEMEADAQYHLQQKAQEETPDSLLDGVPKIQNVKMIEVPELAIIVKEEVKEEKVAGDIPVVAEDLTKITILKADSDEKTRRLYQLNKQKRRDNRPTTQVVLPGSCYSAAMAGLSSLEIEVITNSNEDVYSASNRLYSLIHEKMLSSSIGKMSYGDFLKITSAHELDILLFGLYCSTYPDVTELPMQCQNDKCNQKFTFSTANADLIVIDDEHKTDVLNGMSRILQLGYTKPDEVLASSEVQKIERIKLKDSEVIIDVRVPSLYNQLEDVMAKITPEIANDPGKMEAADLIVFVDSLFIPDSEYGGYIEVKDFADKLDEIFYLSDADIAQFSAVVGEKVKKFQLKFGLKTPTCTHCGKVHDTVDYPIQQVLFTKHRQLLSANK